MPHAFSWVEIVPGLRALPVHLATGLVVTLALIGLALAARRQLAGVPDAAVPDPSLTARNLMEIFVEKFADLVGTVVGPHSRQYVPLYGSFFLYILSANLIGLVPGFEPVTSNFNVPLALGVTSFCMYHYYGLRAHGRPYFRHFLGPIPWLVVLMLPLELIDHCLRPVTLALRLFMNMFADHLVLGVFTDLTKLLIPVAFYGLGAFVSLIQTFVFVLLSLVYVALAVAGHGEH